MVQDYSRIGLEARRMQNNQLKQVGAVLNSVGWFRPPYIGVGLLETVANKITTAKMTGFAPSLTSESKILADRYRQLQGR